MSASARRAHTHTHTYPLPDTNTYTHIDTHTRTQLLTRTYGVKDTDAHGITGGLTYPHAPTQYIRTHKHSHLSYPRNNNSRHIHLIAHTAHQIAFIQTEHNNLSDHYKFTHPHHSFSRQTTYPSFGGLSLSLSLLTLSLTWGGVVNPFSEVHYYYFASFLRSRHVGNVYLRNTSPLPKHYPAISIPI